MFTTMEIIIWDKLNVADILFFYVMSNFACLCYKK